VTAFGRLLNQPSSYKTLEPLVKEILTTNSNIRDLINGWNRSYKGKSEDQYPCVPHREVQCTLKGPHRVCSAGTRPTLRWLQPGFSSLVLFLAKVETALTPPATPARSDRGKKRKQLSEEPTIYARNQDLEQENQNLKNEVRVLKERIAQLEGGEGF